MTSLEKVLIQRQTNILRKYWACLQQLKKSSLFLLRLNLRNDSKRNFWKDVQLRRKFTEYQGWCYKSCLKRQQNSNSKKYQLKFTQNVAPIAKVIRSIILALTPLPSHVTLELVFSEIKKKLNLKWKNWRLKKLLQVGLTEKEKGIKKNKMI